jgi:hypothetical protein
MSTNGKLTLDEGLISVNLPTPAAIDAAVSGDMAGIEFEVDHANITIGPRSDYRAPLTLSISLHPGKMLELAVALLDALGTPAFNEREWRTIANALRDQFAVVATEGNAHSANELHKLAAQIERAYHPEAA